MGQPSGTTQPRRFSKHVIFRALVEVIAGGGGDGGAGVGDIAAAAAAAAVVVMVGGGIWTTRTT